MSVDMIKMQHYMLGSNVIKKNWNPYDGKKNCTIWTHFKVPSCP